MLIIAIQSNEALDGIKEEEKNTIWSKNITSKTGKYAPKYDKRMKSCAKMNPPRMQDFWTKQKRKILYKIFLFYLFRSSLLIFLEIR